MRTRQAVKLDPFVRQRMALGLNQAGLAERLGVSKAAVGQWEAGVAIPRPATIVKIAEVFGVSALDVLNMFAPEISSVNEAVQQGKSNLEPVS